MPRPRSHPPVLKRFGQHFLVDQKALNDIADAALAGKHDVVIEVGPGRGALTEKLVERAGRVIAIEIDHQLAELLAKRYAGDPRVTVVERDYLEVTLSDLTQPPFVVVGNVPYYITTPILFHTLQPPLPARCVFLVQREVADRIVAQPGSREYGALSVNVQALANAEVVRRVAAGAFKPPPKVDSAVVRITPREKPLIPEDELAEFREFVLAVFGMRRKQITNILRSLRRLSAEEATRILGDAGIDVRARPETLRPDQLVKLMRVTR
jgi:16S rRNA (adenine1518-N6/adenine1519-N6)-dimethyltransferase